MSRSNRDGVDIFPFPNHNHILEKKTCTEDQRTVTIVNCQDFSQFQSLQKKNGEKMKQPYQYYYYKSDKNKIDKYNITSIRRSALMESS